MKRFVAFIVALLMLVSVATALPIPQLFGSTGSEEGTATTSAAAEAVTAILTINGETVADGATYTIIEDTLPTDVSFDAGDSTPTGELDYSWSITGETLDNSSAESFTQSLDAGSYQVQLLVTDQANASNTDTVNAILDIEEANQAITINSASYQALPGSTTPISIKVENTGNVESTVSFALQNVGTGLTIDLDQTSMTLQPGDSLYLEGTGTLASNTVPGTIISATLEGSFDGTATSAVISFTVQTPPEGTKIDITESTVTVGNEDTARENTVTSTFTVKNTGATVLTGITLSSTAASRYDVVFSPASIAALAPLETRTVEVSAYIPDDQDSGTNKIGTIKVEATGNNTLVTDTANLDMGTRSELEITRVEAEMKDQDDTDRLDNGDKFRARPGEEVELTITVENNFNENIDIEDIEVNAFNDDDLDFDETDDIGDLRDGRDAKATITFTVDRDLDDGDEYDITITATGEDENGATHTDEWTVTLEVERENHFISIRDITLRPSTVTCQLSTTVDVDVENLGADDEDEVVIEVISDDLDYDKAVKNLQLDVDDDLSRSLTITWDKPLIAGTYFIDVQTYYDTSRKSDFDTVELTALGCSTTPEEEEQNESGGIVIEPGETGNEGTTGNVVFVESGAASVSDIVYIVLLVLAGILVIVIIIFLLKKAFA